MLDSSPDEIQSAGLVLFFFLNVRFCSPSSPIFEEDTPSVMEIEMEELDKWMSSMARNGTWRPGVSVCLFGDGKLAGCLGFSSRSGILKPHSIWHRSEWSLSVQLNHQHRICG